MVRDSFWRTLLLNILYAGFRLYWQADLRLCFLYTLLSLVYTAINVPYCAMINNISNDSRERVSLQSWRFALSTLGGLIVSLTALPLVAWLGQGNGKTAIFTP